MSAVLFWKKRIYLIVSGGLSTLFVCCALLYAYLLVGIQTITLNKRFYYLVSDSTHIEASTEIIGQNGGAGYLLTKGKKLYVAMAVYLTEEAAQKVYIKVAATEKNVQTLTLFADKLYLKTYLQKSKKEQIEGAFTSLYGCIEVLNGEIERLAKGATQESSQKILTLLKKQLEYLSKINEKILPSYSKLCEKGAQSLFAMLQDTIYVKDLRYLQCNLCHSFVDMAGEYAL